MAEETTTPAATAATLVAAGVVAAPATYQQLTQLSVPLDDADAAFSTPDAAGRLPIVILPDQPLRIRNELVIGGILAILAYTGWFTTEHFADSIGWPLALMAFGIFMIGLSALAVRIDRKYVRG